MKIYVLEDYSDYYPIFEGLYLSLDDLEQAAKSSLMSRFGYQVWEVTEGSLTLEEDNGVFDNDI